MRFLRRFVREAWSGKESAYRELQQTRLQIVQQQQHMALLVRTAPEVKRRIEALWAAAMPAWKIRARCLERWHEVHRAHCAARWAACQAERLRVAPIPMRREAAR